jgi:hypothetical protein
MNKDLNYYNRLLWRVIIEPERQDDGSIVFVASPLEFAARPRTGESQTRRWPTCMQPVGRCMKHYGPKRIRFLNRL